jgi:hypothetical protein
VGVGGRGVAAVASIKRGKRGLEKLLQEEIVRLQNAAVSREDCAAFIDNISLDSRVIHLFLCRQRAQHLNKTKRQQVIATEHKYPLIKETNDTKCVPLCPLTALWRKTLGWTYRETRMKKVSAFVWRNGNVISAKNLRAKTRGVVMHHLQYSSVQLKPAKKGCVRMSSAPPGLRGERLRVCA